MNRRRGRWSAAVIVVLVGLLGGLLAWRPGPRALAPVQEVGQASRVPATDAADAGGATPGRNVGPPLPEAVLSGPVDAWYALARERGLRGDATARWLLGQAMTACLRRAQPGRRLGPANLEEALASRPLPETARWAAPHESPEQALARERREVRLQARMDVLREREEADACRVLGQAAWEEAPDWLEPLAVVGGEHERHAFAQTLQVFASDQGRLLRHLDATAPRIQRAARWMREAAEAGDGAASGWLADNLGRQGYSALLPHDPEFAAALSLAGAHDRIDAVRADLRSRDEGLDDAAWGRVERVAERLREARARRERAEVVALRRSADEAAATGTWAPVEASWPAWRQVEWRTGSSRLDRLRLQAEADEAAAEAEARPGGTP